MRVIAACLVLCATSCAPPRDDQTVTTVEIEDDRSNAEVLEAITLDPFGVSIRTSGSGQTADPAAGVR